MGNTWMAPLWVREVVGPELYKKSLGVIGLGAIGSLVANMALSLGMDVYGYDPFLSVDAALRLDRHIHVVKDINELYKRADYITIHIHFTAQTKGMIDESAILPDTFAPPVHVTFNKQLSFHLSSPRICSFSPNEIVSLLASHALTKL